VLIEVEKTYNVSCSDVARRTKNNNKLHSQNLNATGHNAEM
jgi:hypothetical protein